MITIIRPLAAFALLFLTSCSLTRNESSLGRRASPMTCLDDGRPLLRGEFGLFGGWLYAMEEPDPFISDTALVTDYFLIRDSLQTRSVFLESRYALQAELACGVNRYMGAGIHYSRSYGPVLGIPDNHPAIVDEALNEWGGYLRFHLGGRFAWVTFRPSLSVGASNGMIYAATVNDTDTYSYRKTYVAFNPTFTLRLQPTRLMGCYFGFHSARRPCGIRNGHLVMDYTLSLFAGMDIRFSRMFAFGLYVLNPADDPDSGESPWQVGGRITILTRKSRSGNGPESQEEVK